MAKCDLCGKTVNGVELNSLLNCYQLPNVRDLCPTCEVWANAQLREIQRANAPELRRRIAARVTPPPQRRSLLSRIFTRS